MNPRLSLTDENDGLSFYKKISFLSRSLLKNGGKIFFEIGAGQSEVVKNILFENEFKNIVVKKDYSGIERIIFGEKNLKVVVQRVSSGGVFIKSENYSKEIGKGFVILLGIREDDVQDNAIFLADKCSNLRVFEDQNEKMNLSLKDVGGEVLVSFPIYTLWRCSTGKSSEFYIGC